MIKKGELGLAMFALGIIIIVFFSDYWWLGIMINILSSSLLADDFFDGDDYE